MTEQYDFRVRLSQDGYRLGSLKVDAKEKLDRGRSVLEMSA